MTGRLVKFCSISKFTYWFILDFISNFVTLHENFPDCGAKLNQKFQTTKNNQEEFFIQKFQNMANLQIIKDLAKERNLPLGQLANELGITAQALSKLMRENSTSVSTLEQIAQILKVSVSVFFETPEAKRTAIAKNGSTAVSGDHNVLGKGNEQLINLVAKQADQISKMLERQAEQNDRLLSLLEKMAQ